MLKCARRASLKRAFIVIKILILIAPRGKTV